MHNLCIHSIIWLIEDCILLDDSTSFLPVVMAQVSSANVAIMLLVGVGMSLVTKIYRSDLRTPSSSLEILGNNENGRYDEDYVRFFQVFVS